MNIKKIILILFSFCQLVFTYGQESRSSIGIKLFPGITKGITASANNYFNSSQYDSIRFSRLTLNCGLSYNYQIIKSKFYVETGLFYSNRGSLIKNHIIKYTYGSYGLGYTSRETKSDIYIYDYYLTVPILFGYKYNTLYTSIGPTFGYNLFRKWVWTPEEDKTEYDRWHELGFFNNVSFGLEINIGTKLKLSEKFGLTIEGAFEISNFKSENGEFIYYKNGELGIGLNYKL